MAATDTRRRILDAALAAFLDQGYEQTTIAGIRARSGTSNGALFHHFRSKEAIAEALYVAGIASFQEGLRQLLRQQPTTLREAVRAAIAHQLAWTEQHADLARFIYLRGHPDRDSPGGTELLALNRELAGGFRAWLAPLIERGEVRPVSMLVLTAIVSGPAHAIARRWLAGQVRGPLTVFTGELADAAWAGLRGTPVPAPAGQAVPATGTLTLELVSADGAIVARGQATARLLPAADEPHADQPPAGHPHPGQPPAGQPAG